MSTKCERSVTRAQIVTIKATMTAKRPWRPARRADAEASPPEESQVESADVNEQPLQDVCVTAQMGSTQSTGLVEVRIRPLKVLASP